MEQIQRVNFVRETLFGSSGSGEKANPPEQVAVKPDKVAGMPEGLPDLLLELKKVKARYLKD